MLAGDFNITAELSKSSNFNGSQRLSNDMKEFKDAVQKVAVFDHPFTGPLFTWFNHQGEGFLTRKLDRVLINDKWLSFLAQSTVEFLPPGVSDHCPALVRLTQQGCSPPKPFKVFNFWTKHPDFLNTVAQSWKAPLEGYPMVVLHKKLKRLKNCLRQFNNLNYAEITKKVERKRKELE